MKSCAVFEGVFYVNAALYHLFPFKHLCIPNDFLEVFRF